MGLLKNGAGGHCFWELRSLSKRILITHRHLLIAALALVLSSTWRNAYAEQIFIDPLTILNFADSGGPPPGGVIPDIGATSFNNGDFDGNGATEFTTIFPAGAPAAGYVSNPNLSILYDEGDTISLEITNNDESPWTFRLWARDFTQNVFAGDFLELDSEESGLISLVFDLTDFVHSLPGDPPITIGNTIITALLVEVSTASSPILIPGENPDFTAEYSIGSGPEPDVVPLPASLPLYGTGLGLMGLFGWWRRRRAVAV
jgi:hypothetical protein